MFISFALIFIPRFFFNSTVSKVVACEERLHSSSLQEIFAFHPPVFDWEMVAAVSYVL